jgi:hypothetical protein
MKIATMQTRPSSLALRKSAEMGLIKIAVAPLTMHQRALGVLRTSVSPRPVCLSAPTSAATSITAANAIMHVVPEACAIKGCVHVPAKRLNNVPNQMVYPSAQTSHLMQRTAAHAARAAVRAWRVSAARAVVPTPAMRCASSMASAFVQT